MVRGTPAVKLSAGPRIQTGVGRWVQLSFP